VGEPRVPRILAKTVVDFVAAQRPGKRLRANHNIVICCCDKNAPYSRNLYREPAGEVPVLDWAGQAAKAEPRAYQSSVAAVERLAEFGHELRRPMADLLRDGIYELRIRTGRVQYRILYFFHGRNVAILGHGLTKRGRRAGRRN